MSEKNVYRVRLLRWGDSSSSGRTVTFKLPDDEEDHPFKGLDVGAKNGQLLEMEIAIYEGDGDVETLCRIRKPRARIKPLLPVIQDETATSPPADTPRRHATMENVTRRVIKTDTPQAAPPAPPAQTSPAAQASAPSGAPTTTTPAAPPAAPPAGTAQAPAQMLTPNIPPTAPTSAPTPPPQTTAHGGGYPNSTNEGPVGNTGAGTVSGSGSVTGGGNLDAGDLDAYASQMGQAAEALAAVAERLDDQADDGQPQFPTMPSDQDDNLDPGVKAVRRATDLCKAIDKQRAGFFYFMRSRYPEAPKMPAEEGNWSRDAKSTRDRVCLHCEATQLADLAQDQEARKKFEELENEFERHERLR